MRFHIFTLLETGTELSVIFEVENFLLSCYKRDYLIRCNILAKNLDAKSHYLYFNFKSLKYIKL